MAVALFGRANVNSVKQQQYVVDAVADIDLLPTTTRGAINPYDVQWPKPVPMGSTAYVIKTGETYILSSDPEVNWTKMKGSTPSPTPDPDPDPDPDPQPTDKKYVYFGVDGVMESDWKAEWDELDDPASGFITERGPIGTYFTKEVLEGSLKSLTKEEVTDGYSLNNKVFTIADAAPAGTTDDVDHPVYNFMCARITIAYPKSLGTLSKFEFNSFQYDDLVRADITIDGEAYEVVNIAGANYYNDYLGDFKILMA